MSEEEAVDPQANRRRERAKIRRLPGFPVKYDDINCVPSIEIDENGMAQRPWTPSNSYEREFSIDERKVRFVLFWAYYGGIKTMACQEAGIPRHIADEWMKETAVKRAMEVAREEIADRLLIRLSQRVGLIPLPEGIKFNDAALFGLVKTYKPEVFGDTGEPSGPAQQAATHIPRPPGTGSPL